MTDAELRRTIRRFFRRYSAARVSFPRATGNLYELFVYTLVCDSVRQVGRALKLCTPVTGEFHFRSSPGVINNAFSYYSFSGPSGHDYQIRNGIEVYGHSKMRHESDIAIFRVLARGRNPQGVHTELVLTIECKCYSTPSRLKSEARKNVGMVQDWSRRAHPSKTGRKAQGCIHCGLDFLPRFVTNVRQGQRLDIEQYLEAYDLGPEFGVIPHSKAVNRFKRVIMKHILSL